MHCYNGIGKDTLDDGNEWLKSPIPKDQEQIKNYKDNHHWVGLINDDLLAVVGSKWHRAEGMEEFEGGLCPPVGWWKRN